MRDPYLLLGIPEDADDLAVEAAYLSAIKACPPERDAVRFQALRTAYEQLRTNRDRVAHELFQTAPPELADLLDRAAPVGEPRRPARALVEALLRGDD
ncbi:J domain-containing protein [Thiorhodococcus mannitoliphagus]|uniref:J domain-containing protein n=1 Tax=Thiorhodococcus mannitoliphagus TaxID=329406 RepID=A0A6P1DW92_9GAMM|nr:J domain-containing protein [Thiorhodococcus mannitoliphagus]NEX22418.1 J domain-containing protein [Thiorhodococcus mannitoliphagus]